MENYQTLDISIVENLEKYNQNQHVTQQKRQEEIVIHNGSWHFARCKTLKQLNDFCSLLGIEYSLHDDRENFKYYKTNTLLKEFLFWNIEEIPQNATKVKGLSNGSIVDCYFVNENNILNVYRPNPNAKEVYKKMEFEKEMEFRKNNVYF